LSRFRLPVASDSLFIAIRSSGERRVAKHVFVRLHRPEGVAPRETVDIFARSLVDLRMLLLGNPPSVLADCLALLFM
jgi:hypothetical protein